jgi:hypothetical protein
VGDPEKIEDMEPLLLPPPSVTPPSSLPNPPTGFRQSQGDAFVQFGANAGIRSDPTQTPPIGGGLVPEAISLMALAEVQPEPEKTLLGDRFLCVGGAMLFVGPSGIGKSSASVQMDILWGLGREAFGIMPARPLRILCIQAENDQGDLGEMARGVCTGLGIGIIDQTSIRENVFYATAKSHVGADFLKKVVAPLLEKHRPDILRIDPLLAYLGADVNDAASTAGFLRNGLNRLLDQFNCAAIINHHTPKVTNRDTSQWRASDWMYAGAGSADLTNWCRAALVIDPTHRGHVFRFIAAKRGGRIGWRDENNERVFERHFCHSTDGGICWREATPDDIAGVAAAKAGGKAAKTKVDLLALVPLEGAILKKALVSSAQNNGIGEKRAQGFLAELLASGTLHEWRIPRPRTNPEIHISRHEHPPV